jgi:hypothetical protein
MADRTSQTIADDWVSFPGGELEGRRPRVLCPPCRDALNRQAATSRAGGRQPHLAGTLCFACYRASLERERALKAAGDLDTAKEERFRFGLPFEPINEVRLTMLKAERTSARAGARQEIGDYADRRRRAQMQARRALQAVFAGVQARELAASAGDRRIAAAIHAAELQLPDAWLPFVVSR